MARCAQNSQSGGGISQGCTHLLRRCLKPLSLSFSLIIRGWIIGYVTKDGDDNVDIVSCKVYRRPNLSRGCA